MEFLLEFAETYDFKENDNTDMTNTDTGGDSKLIESLVKPVIQTGTIFADFEEFCELISSIIKKTCRKNIFNVNSLVREKFKEDHK